MRHVPRVVLLEVTDAVVHAWSADRVAVRISPIGIR